MLDMVVHVLLLALIAPRQTMVWYLLVIWICIMPCVGASASEAAEQLPSSQGDHVDGTHDGRLGSKIFASSYDEEATVATIWRWYSKTIVCLIIFLPHAPQRFVLFLLNLFKIMNSVLVLVILTAYLPGRVEAVQHRASASRAPSTASNHHLHTLAVGCVMGTIHTVTGPDHMSALVTLAVNHQHCAAARLGVRWGVGHSLGLLTVTGAVLILRDACGFDQETMLLLFSNAVDWVVGVIMLLLGLWGYHTAWRLRRHEHELHSYELTGREAATVVEDRGGAREAKAATFAGTPVAELPCGRTRSAVRGQSDARSDDERPRAGSLCSRPSSIRCSTCRRAVPASRCISCASPSSLEVGGLHPLSPSPSP